MLLLGRASFESVTSNIPLQAPITRLVRRTSDSTVCSPRPLRALPAGAARLSERLARRRPVRLMRLLRGALLRPALQHARFCAAGKASPPAQPKPAVKQAAQHAVVTSTHIFRISNPEAFMDPSKRVSWIVTGVVAALLAARFGYALYQDDGEFFESKPAPAPSDVRKTLPDGRWARCADTRATPQPYRNCHTCGKPVPGLLCIACVRACGAGQ